METVQPAAFWMKYGFHPAHNMCDSFVTREDEFGLAARFQKCLVPFFDSDERMGVQHIGLTEG